MKLPLPRRVNPLRPESRYAVEGIPVEMKKLHHCPKCSGRKIWVIERYRVPGGETTSGIELAVLPHQADPLASRFSFAKVKPVGSFDLYLCDGCGYSELWADNFRGLVPDPEKGIRLLDTSDANEGPFR